MTTVHTLASGSSGNAALFSCGDTHLLMDAGISCRRITAGLAALGLSDLRAILITHTHTDHISGLRVLLKRTDCLVASSLGVCRVLASMLPELSGRLLPLEWCVPYQLEGISITPFPISHDAPGACGYRLDTQDGSVGFLTDTGYVTPQAADILPGVDLAFLEANYDVETLCSGPYPYALRQRILGREGHLCNEDAARFAVTLAQAGASEIVLAHLSRENNTPAMAYNAVARALSVAGLSPALTVAPRDELSAAFAVSGRAVCKK